MQNGMTRSRKVKISISLAADLLKRIDREAEGTPGESRSSVIERWLRGSARRVAEEQLAAEVMAYYDSMTPEERAEEEEMGRALSAAAKRLVFDDDGFDEEEPRRSQRVRAPVQPRKGGKKRR